MKSFVSRASLIVVIMSTALLAGLPTVKTGEVMPLNWTSPTTQHLISVFMVSPSDGWAVGDHGTIIHWNGTLWSIVASPIANVALLSVFMVNSSEGWAVGDRGTIIHWNGSSWSLVANPATNYLNSPAFFSVSMVSVDDGWAVGSQGVIIHWNGTSWSTITSPTTHTDFHSVFMINASDGWAVGYARTTIVHWNGTIWNEVTSPTSNPLHSVFMVSASDGWAVGYGGGIIRWDGTSWSNVPSPTTVWLNSVFMVSASNGWAVGSDGTIISWNGTSWSTAASPTVQDLWEVFMISASDGWAVGLYGTIIHLAWESPDTIPPSIQILSPTNHTYLEKDIPLNFTLTESISWIGYSVDHQNNLTVSGNITLLNLPEGAHTITVYANDTHGNMGRSDTVHFTLDTTTPTIQIVQPENKTYAASSVPLNFTLSEPANWIRFSLDGRPNITVYGPTNVILSGLSDDPHNIIVYATDTAGHAGASERRYFTVDSAQPPYSTTIDWPPIVATSVVLAGGFAGLIGYIVGKRRSRRS